MFHAAALAAPLLVAATVGWTAWAHGPDTALACAVTLTSQDGLMHVEGRGRAPEHMTGTYHLEVRRAGAELRQSGPFTLAPREDVTFSRISLNGPRQSIEATLTLTIGDESVICPETT
jgi:hypothetical protein